jgi:hypothetical protein
MVSNCLAAQALPQDLNVMRPMRIGGDGYIEQGVEGLGRWGGVGRGEEAVLDADCES